MNEVLQAALALPPKERGVLADVLGESMGEAQASDESAPELSAAWRAENCGSYFSADLKVRGLGVGVCLQQALQG